MLRLPITMLISFLLLLALLNHYSRQKISIHKLQIDIASKEYIAKARSYDSAPKEDPSSPEPASNPLDEVLFSSENAYNPIPSPDGTRIAYVRTGWDRGGIASFTLASLRSEVMVMDTAGRLLTQTPLADAFLSGWTADGAHLICYREWKSFLVSLDGTKSKYTRIPKEIPSYEQRVTYLSNLKAMVWVQRSGESSVIRTHGKTIAQKDSPLSEILIPSPDERYIAAIGLLDKVLWVYNIKSKLWAALGRVTVHPDANWYAIKATWNPWFADSSRLAFISDSSLVISSPDGEAKQKIINPNSTPGLAVPSPDGKLIAYVTFESIPKKQRKDLTFWGNTTIWVVPAVSGSRARPVTKKVPETTYDLQWLSNRELVFDRFADDPFYSNVRLWKTMITEP